jgi:hypothetical protein
VNGRYQGYRALFCIGRGMLCTRPSPQLAKQPPAASPEQQAFAESVKPSKELVSQCSWINIKRCGCSFGAATCWWSEVISWHQWQAAASP